MERRELAARQAARAAYPLAWVTGSPKGGRERTVDLPASVVDALKRHRHLRGPYVFCLQAGQPLTDGLMKLPLQRAVQRAGISREQVSRRAPCRPVLFLRVS